MDERGAWAADAARDALLTHLENIQRTKATLEADEARTLAALEAWRPVGDVMVRDEWARQAWIREEVACVLRVAPQTASGRLAQAAMLVERLPGALAALKSGALSGAHVRTLQDAALSLDEDTLAALEARVLPRSESLSVSEFRARCRRAVLAVDPVGAERRHAVARQGRSVVTRVGSDGMGELSAYLDQATLTRIRERVQSCADACDAGERSADAVRADVFCDLLLGEPGTSAELRSRAVQVTVAFSTLAGLDELPGEIDRDAAPATLVRVLANDPGAWWRPVLVDRDGHVEAVGARTYRPSAALRRLVELHDRTCQFPGCRRRAENCELDHAEPFTHAAPAAGGLTEFDNLHALCKRHHRLKHETGWSVLRKDGITTWLSPTGRAYTKINDGHLDSYDDGLEPRPESDGPGPPTDEPPPF